MMVMIIWLLHCQDRLITRPVNGEIIWTLLQNFIFPQSMFIAISNLQFYYESNIHNVTNDRTMTFTLY